MCIRDRLYGLVFKNEGRIAARNLKNNRNISQSITLLFISISAVIAITVVGNFVTAYITDVFRGAQLQGFADGPMDSDFVEQVRRMEGVGTVLPLHELSGEVQGNGVPFARLEATDCLLYTSGVS